MGRAENSSIESLRSKAAAVLPMLLLVGCAEASLRGAGGDDPDGDLDGGSDSDSESETWDTGSETGPDADSDADTDTDTDSDSDADTDTDTDVDTDADTDADTDTDSDMDIDVDADTDSDTDTDTDTGTVWCGNGVCDDGEDSSSCPEDCATVLPKLRVEIHPDNWWSGGLDMYVDWYDPIEDLCEEWNDPEICDWGSYGTASISGDDYGSQDPNWIEITGSEASSGYYRGEVSSYECDSFGDCGMDEVKIFVDGTLERTIDIGNEDLWISQTLCMPVGPGGWLVDGFWWQSGSSCE